MKRQINATFLSFLISSWLAASCHSFSFDGRGSVSFVASNSRCSAAASTNLLRHRSSFHLPSSWFYSTETVTKLWSSPSTNSEVESSPPETQEEPSSLDLHPPTLTAISAALLTRAQNTPGMPLRYIDNGSMEPWEITMTAGKIAEQYAEDWARQNNLSPLNPDHEEVMHVMAGRVVGAVARFEELEEELLKRCCRLQSDNEGGSVADQLLCLGVPDAELTAYQSLTGENQEQERIDATAAAIDAASLFDEPLRNNRARSLLAIFLQEIEGPGLRANNVVIPCMEVDFLSEKEWGVLFESPTDDDKEGGVTEIKAVDEVDDLIEEEAEGDELNEDRPSLHPITIDAIEEAFRLRAQNSTTSPLRLLDGNSEWFEVQYSIVKFADRFLQKFSPKSKAGSADVDEIQMTEEELQTIGGRIVGVLMRLDDLEWEWNHRITTSSLMDVPVDIWKATLGLHPDSVEQSCIRTIDEALLKETEFARARAERMLALFLMNIEGPGLKANGAEVPGGSEPDFIEDVAQLDLMMPRPKK